MPRIPKKIRWQVIERAKARCEYCQTQQAIVGYMEIDHIVPVSAGGSNDIDNLSLACHVCNHSKLDAETSIDAETGEEVSLFNPRHQKWSEHFYWNEDKTMIVGLTAIGRATIIRLKMNNAEIVKARSIWVAAGWHPPKEAL